MNMQKQKTKVDHDVVVIGAGLAGLTAATQLTDRGFDVRVLEARDRVGGRNEGGTFADGQPIELGGQWVGPTQDEVLKLIEQVGLETFTVYDEGESLLAHNGQLSRGDNDNFGLPPASAQELSRLVELIDTTCASFDLERPWESPEAQRLDAMTTREWLDEHCRDDLAREFLEVMLVTLLAAEAEEHSALHFLFYMASGGGLHRLMITIGGAQEARVLGGTHQISERLAERLGEAVQLNHEVLSIRYEQLMDSAENVVTVETVHGTVTANRAIVALPPMLAGRLRYDPPMPANRDALTAQVPAGYVIKFQAMYDTPFWRDNGLSGEAMSLEHSVSLTYDNCVPNSDKGILVGFVEGHHAKAFNSLDEDQRRERILADLVELFGTEAAEPTDFLQRNWNEQPFTRGCYGGRLGTGVWTHLGRYLREPVGPIHWASAETAAVWSGYMDGAVRSGQRAAQEIADALPR